MKQLPPFFNVIKTPCKRFNKIAKYLVFATCFACAMAPSICHAENGGTGFILPTALTKLTALPDSSIAVVTGTGLQGPTVGGSAISSPPIILWDELRPANQESTINSGIVTITVNGVVQ
jgi:hypothetical protein